MTSYLSCACIGVDAFDDEVDAYPAVTTVRKGPASDHLKFVNCAPEFNEADTTAVLDLMDDEPGWLVSGSKRSRLISRPVIGCIRSANHD